jgi:transposase
MSRAATQVTLHADERQVLQKRAQARRVERRHQQRARVVLLAAQGWSNEQIAPHVGLNVNSVRKWRDRYARAGLAALEDEPRTGRPSRLDPQKVKVVLSEVVQPPAPRTRWSVRSYGVPRRREQKHGAETLGSERPQTPPHAHL